MVISMWQANICDYLISFDRNVDVISHFRNWNFSQSNQIKWIYVWNHEMSQVKWFHFFLFCFITNLSISIVDKKQMENVKELKSMQWIGLEFLHVHLIRHRRPRRRWSLVNYCYSSSQGNTTARCSDVGCILFSKNKMIRFGRKEKLFCFIFGLSVLQNRFLNANFCYYLQSNRQ